jgi:hypothetical protein
MSEFPTRRLRAEEEEQAIDLFLAEAVFESMTDPDNQIQQEAEILETMGQYSYVPHPHFDRLVVTSVLAGADAYLEENLNLIATACSRMRNALINLRTTTEKEEQFAALHHFRMGASFVLRYFHQELPSPPFLHIEEVLPVPNKEMGVVHVRTGEEWGHLDTEFHSFKYDLKYVERHVERTQTLVPPNKRQYLKRFYYWFILDRCRRVKEAKFRRALGRLTIATDSFQSFLQSYLGHYHHAIKFRQEFDEPL